MPPGTPAHLLGTDALGRDILSRVIHGARLTLSIAVLVVVLVVPVGLAVGTLSGFLGGWVDTVLMRLTDIALAFPKIVLALALAAALGPGVINAVIAISITAWPAYARLARAETLRLVQADFIHAARLQGASNSRLLLKYIVPLCSSSVIVRATLDMAGIVLTVAGLGFLGLGAQPPSPEWGFMVASGRNVLIDAWWVATVPGIAILLVSLAFNLLGDGLRDVFDPRHGD
jgi:peptide/nickel transport system permease protein